MTAPASTVKKRTCFVIMPISEAAPYEQGHFRRVYDHILKPACVKAGFEPVRADDIERTNHIILDILRRIIQADVVLCDLSAKNPNVMYELGIRQAFNKPVVLVKDNQTERVFDIQGLRDVEYDSTLRIDRTAANITAIATAITNTTDGDNNEVNSLIQLLGVQAAAVPQKTEVSTETSLILNALGDLGKRMAAMEGQVALPKQAGSLLAKPIPKSDDFPEFPAGLGNDFRVGAIVNSKKHGQGKVIAINGARVTGRFAKGAVEFDANDPDVDDLPF